MPNITKEFIHLCGNGFAVPVNKAGKYRTMGKKASCDAVIFSAY